MTKLYYSWEDINGMMSDITQQMATKMLRPHVILGPGRGGFPIGVMMSHYFDIPFHGFEWQTRDGVVQNSNQLRQLLSKYNGKRIVVIDDINDTGTTLKGIHDIVEKEGMVDNVKYVTLLEKMSSDFSVQITAKELDEEEGKQWIVFPYEEWWNNKTGEQRG
tara:strand:- start:783 stop:1268 length:486 start_codon:yes stop_codon:yes gene_type:complete